MKLHPREMLLQQSRQDLAREVGAVQDRYGLSDIELANILHEVQSTTLRDLMKEEYEEKKDT